MNAHDSERIAGLLDEMGYHPAPPHTPSLGEPGLPPADVVVLNTCAVRENADNRLYGTLGHLQAMKNSRPGMQIAVGGCLAQKDREIILKRAPWVDVVFGTHNLSALPVLLERSARVAAPQIEIVESLQAFPSELPVRRGATHCAWVSISVGCNNSCSFCIVPSLRGKERDRGISEVVAEIEALVSVGVTEVTLLGQNVNSYGVEFGDRQAFSKLLRRCGKIADLERVRFISPHPKDFTDDVIDAMADTHNVMPHLHMPLQSGSNKILQAMKRSYRSDRYLSILSKVRSAMPEASITTDVIVGFPGETEEDFQQTLNVVRQSRFALAFTFKYSKRPGTPAAELPDQIESGVVSERYQRLVDLVNETAWQENRDKIGENVEVMVSAVSGKKDHSRESLSGRARDNRLVHFQPGAVITEPGDIVEVSVTEASPFFLVSTAPVLSHRRPSGLVSSGPNKSGADLSVHGRQGPSIVVGQQIPLMVTT